MHQKRRKPEGTKVAKAARQRESNSKTEPRFTPSAQSGSPRPKRASKRAAQRMVKSQRFERFLLRRFGPSGSGGSGSSLPEPRSWPRQALVSSEQWSAYDAAKRTRTVNSVALVPPLLARRSWLGLPALESLSSSQDAWCDVVHGAPRISASSPRPTALQDASSSSSRSRVMDRRAPPQGGSGPTQERSLRSRSSSFPRRPGAAPPGCFAGPRGFRRRRARHPP